MLFTHAIFQSQNAFMLCCVDYSHCQLKKSFSCTGGISRNKTCQFVVAHITNVKILALLYDYMKNHYK